MRSFEPVTMEHNIGEFLIGVCFFWRVVASRASGY